MTDKELMQQAPAYPEGDVVGPCVCGSWPGGKCLKCPWVEQAEKRKPVAWMYVNFDDECEQIEYGEPFDDPSVTPLYAAPPARQWVGLTDEEVEQVFPAIATYHAANKTLYHSIARAIEVKLKEKNT